MAVTIHTFGQLPNTIPPLPPSGECNVSISRPHKGQRYACIEHVPTRKVWIVDEDCKPVAHFPSATAATKRIMGVREDGKVTSINGRDFFNLPPITTVPAKAPVEAKVVLPPTPPQPVKVPEIKTWPMLIRRTLGRLKAGFVQVFRVGPAGCGKTHMGAILAEAVGAKNYVAIGCARETTKSEFFGHPTATGGRVETPFLKALIEGGVILLDEMPKLDPSVASALNMVLANGRITVGGKTYIRHAECYVIGTGNSFGRGSKTYATDQAQDVAYVDRFIGAVLPVDYDVDYEASVADHLPMGKTFRMWPYEIRAKVVADGKCGRVVSTRWIQAGAMLLKAGASLDETRKAMLMGWSPDEITRFVPGATA